MVILSLSRRYSFPKCLSADSESLLLPFFKNAPCPKKNACELPVLLTKCPPSLQFGQPSFYPPVLLLVPPLTNCSSLVISAGNKWNDP